MSSVERSAANIIRAIVEFLPGGFLITQVLDKYNVFTEAAITYEGYLRFVKYHRRFHQRRHR
ncbi:MAG: hypothetical protein R2776_04610 [Flavobacteriaceae bacterium]